MSIELLQLRDVIIRPALTAIGLCSDSAIALLLGTAAQESSLGRYVKQTNTDIGGWGIYQMEETTYHYVWNTCIDTSIAMTNKIRLYLGYLIKPNYTRLASDLGLATIITRLYYHTFAEPLPDANNVEALAKYWKKYYNTLKGKGTEAEFISNYNRYILIK